jgi:hypothetical protein
MLVITTARLEIDKRNRTRADAHLPLLSPAQELRRLYKADRERQFEDFCRTAPIRRQVEDRLLARLRRLRRDPQWKPTGFLSGEGWRFLSGSGERCGGFGGCRRTSLPDNSIH